MIPYLKEVCSGRQPRVALDIYTKDLREGASAQRDVKGAAMTAHSLAPSRRVQCFDWPSPGLQTV